MVKILRQRLRRLSPAERLTFVAIVASVGLWVPRACEQITAGLTVHDAAAAFAQVLRDAEVECRNRNQFLTVVFQPASPGRACAYVVRSQDKEIKRGELPAGVAAAGEVTLDPQGVPVAASEFNFRKGPARLRVVMDVRGNVSIPP